MCIYNRTLNICFSPEINLLAHISPLASIGCEQWINIYDYNLKSLQSCCQVSLALLFVSIINEIMNICCLQMGLKCDAFADVF